MRRLALLGFIWGWSFVLLKVATRAATPTTVAGARTLLGAVVLAALSWWRGVRLPRDRATWGWLAVVSVAGAALPLGLLAWSAERITSTLIAVVNTSTPLATALLSGLVLRERLRPSQLVGLGLGVLGVAVAVGIGGDDLDRSSLTGAAAVVGSGFSYGIAFILMRRHLLHLPSDVAAGAQLALASVLLAPLAVVSTGQHGLDLTPWRVSCLVVLGVVSTGIAWSMNYRVVRELGPTRASLVGYLIPVVGVTGGVVVLGEPFHLRVVAGGLVILLAVTLVNRGGALRGLIPRPVTAPGALVLLAVALVVGGTGCAAGSSAGDDRGACAAPVRERLDAASSLHLLPNAEEPDYLSDPPTSGAHLAGAPATGVQTQPLSRPAQVGVLETGAVLLQHDPDLGTTERRELEGLAGAQVVVAPNDDLPDQVVATAWTWKQTCSAVDVEALARFVDEHAGDPSTSSSTH